MIQLSFEILQSGRHWAFSLFTVSYLSLRAIPQSKHSSLRTEVYRDKVFCMWSFSWDVAGAFGNSIGEYYIPQSLRVNAGVSGDVGLIPGSGRSPGVGDGNSLQYSCLENPMDRGAWQATVRGIRKSQTQLKRLSTMYLVTKPPPVDRRGS